MNEELRKAYIIIGNAIKHYKCLQEEDFWIEFDESHNIWVLNWHSYMDSYINMTRVKQVAKFIRKHSSFPIYNSWGLMKI